MIGFFSPYIFYTIPETPFNSIENRNLTNDFPINGKVNFKTDHTIDQETLDSYRESLRLLDIEDPADKISDEKLFSVNERLRNDFTRLLGLLGQMGFGSTEDILFITIGNSMESYGYLLNLIYPNHKIGHIKVSRTLKDNIEASTGKAGRIKLFHNYFHQKITEISKRFETTKTIVIIDTFGAGETMSTILHPFIKKGFEDKPELLIFAACLLEGGNTGPSFPYVKNIRIVHGPDSSDYPDQLRIFKNSSDEDAVMPVLAFNEYIPVIKIREALEEKTTAPSDVYTRFGRKKLCIYIEFQKVRLANCEEFIIIPSETTRLLANVNYYYPVAQKTVFIASDIETGDFITRDGYGFSRKEKPPMMLHRMNNDLSFSRLSIHSKIMLLLHKDAEILHSLSTEIKNILCEITDEDIVLAKQAFIGFLLKKIICHKLYNYYSVGDTSLL